MLKKYFDLLLKFHKTESSMLNQCISLGIGAVFFLIVLPTIFYYIADLFSVFFQFEFSLTYEMPVIIISVSFGLFFLFWATITQFRIGRGTPAPNAPTQKLVILGPYRYTRNPIEFGALFYYLGFGLFFGTSFHGIVCLFLGFIIGSSYHKFIEEKELLLRFGEEYQQYKDSTPFLIPRFRKIS